MTTFPGDMNIGWGFGYVPQTSEELQALDNLIHEETQPTDPRLSVSELEQRVIALEQTHWEAILDLRVTSQWDSTRDQQGINANTSSILMLQQRITDLEERLRSMTLVVNVLCSSMHDVMYQEKN